METLFDFLRLIVRGGYLSLMAAIGILIYQVSSQRLRQTKRRFIKIFIATFCVAALLIIADFTVKADSVRLAQFLFSIIFLYSLAIYLFVLNYRIRKRITPQELLEIQIKIDEKLFQMKQPYAKKI